MESENLDQTNSMLGVAILYGLSLFDLFNTHSYLSWIGLTISLVLLIGLIVASRSENR